VIKYKCASRGYTAWWQRKLYFTSLTAYILVIPAVLMTFCYVNVVLVVWRRSRELHSARTATLSTTKVRQEHGDSSETPEVKVQSRTGANLPRRSQSDVAGYRRFCRFRRVTSGAAADLSPQPPEVDQLSATATENGGSSNEHFRRRRGRLFLRSATMDSYTADQISTTVETGSRSSSPCLRRATGFNMAAMSRARVRTVQMTLCIVLSFIACWAPYFSVHLIHIWSEYRTQMPEVVYVFAETLALVNSAVNPLLYALFNSSMSCWRCCCRRRRHPVVNRPLECVDLHNARPHTNAFLSSSMSSRFT